MSRHSSENNLIWESYTHNKPSPHNLKKQKAISRELDDLFEQDIEYVTQFLINEGLVDNVKAGFGAVKDFVGKKLIKPIIDMIVGAIGKDPELAAQAAQAAQQGPEALQALAQQKGDQSLVQQIFYTNLPLV